MVPYTGRLGARVVHFEPGHVRVRLVERRAVRNHLRSVHAVALANMGELATGLAMLGALPPRVRGILTGLEVTYAKKARGVLVAECRCTVPEVLAATDVVVAADVRDAAGDAVARVAARWRVDPVVGPT
jgi:acyl-coenzyme A thioesterase PaaI-like protein